LGASAAGAAAFFMPFFMAFERGDGGQINKLSREWSPALERWTTISPLQNKGAENESTSTGPKARPLERAPQQILIFIFCARAPRAPWYPGRHPRAIRRGFGDFRGPPGSPRDTPRPKAKKKRSQTESIEQSSKGQKQIRTSPWIWSNLPCAWPSWQPSSSRPYCARDVSAGARRKRLVEGRCTERPMYRSATRYALAPNRIVRRTF
jgi:hypothetical protein